MTFVKQAAARGLFQSSLVILPSAEQSFQDLKEEMPNGVVSLPRATGGYFCTQILAATCSRKPSSRA